MIRRLSALALAALPLAATSAIAQETPPEHPIVRQVERIRAEVAKYRGLEYQTPVKVGVKAPPAIREMVMQSFEEEAPAEEMAKQEKVLKAFGLIPQDYELRARTIDFLSENIGGYYDPEKKELFLVDQSQNPQMQGVPGAQGMMDEMVMAHELYHALQDQTYDLSRWFEVLGDHEDRVQGYKSLVEGEAQLVGMAFLFKKMGRGDVDIAQWNRMQDMMLRMSPEGAKVRAIPPYLVENMMFPYTQGAEFIQTVQRKIGWEKLDQGFVVPPTSTEQVLHPDKYLSEPRDEPTELVLPALGKPLGKKPTDLCENTLGEFNVSVLLRALGVDKGLAARAAAGWDGDRYAGYETEDHRVVVVWVSTWDSEAEAQEFEATYGRAIQGRAGTTIQRRGTEVAMVCGANDEERPQLFRRAFCCLKVEEHFTPTPSMLAKPPATDFDPNAPVAAAGPAGSTPSTDAPAATARQSLLRLDAEGVTLGIPDGFELVDHVEHELANKGDIALHVRPFPGALADVAAREGGRKTGAATIAGRPAILSTREDGAKQQACAWVDLGGSTLGVLLAGPKAKAAELEAALAFVTGSLWIDGAAATGAQRVSLGDASLESLAGFTAKPGQGPILGTLEHASGAKVQVVKVADAGSLQQAAAALEAQLPLVLADYKARSSGMVRRGGRTVHELDFEGGGRRTRQITWVQGGQRITVACSAPLAQFDAQAAAFGRALASAALAGAAPATPGAPEAPKPERRAY